jgi:hypothetical protein
VSEPTRTKLSDKASDYLTGPVGGESSRTEGGTTRDGQVAKFGSSRTGPDAPTGDESPAPDNA